MTCQACKARGKTWNGDDPTCAFSGRSFSPKNWNCATAGLIRDLVFEGQDPMPTAVDYRYCDDVKYATVQIDDLDIDGAMALWVAWYKSRGTTDAMWLLFNDRPPRQPTEAECLLIAEAHAEAHAETISGYSR